MATFCLDACNDNQKLRVARAWIAKSVAILAAERERAKISPLLKLDCPELAGVDIYLKDESSHPSGSLKHRLAHALFVHAICNGEVGPETVIVEASSGSTAISEAWFARSLGLRFVAVVPESTAPEKLRLITELGGEVRAAKSGEDICALARAIAAAEGGHFMDQFGRAAQVTDWRGSNNIAESLFRQMAGEQHAAPSWIVVGAGTGGTSATIGRYIRFQPALARTRLCVVDPKGSAFFAAFSSGDAEATGCSSTIVEGIGRSRVEPSFMPALVDHMLSIADAASVAGARWLEERMGRRFGPSTGTNIVGALLLGQAMARRGARGSIVTLGCDAGERYAATIYDDAWLRARDIDIDDWRDLPGKIAESRFPGSFAL